MTTPTRTTILPALLALASLGGAFSAPTSAEASFRISMPEAETRCFNRAQRFANESVGPNARERSDFEIRSAYKRCIYGYTGQSPDRIPTIVKK